MLVAKELEVIDGLMANPKRPMVAIMGGAKVSDKIDVVESLLNVVDSLCIGGAMANTFLAALGKKTAASKIEDDKLPLARTILEKARGRGVSVLLPVDVVVAKSLDAESGTVVSVDAIPEGTMALDIGPKTIDLYRSVIAGAKTVTWNGPMGVFEIDAFAKGTLEVAKAVAAVKGTTVIGGINEAVSQFTEDSTPGLSRLPLLGRLFRRDSTNEDEGELLIFITPRIMRDGGPVK